MTGGHQLMTTTLLLPGITQLKFKTDRLETAYLEAGAGNTATVLVHGNCSSSQFSPRTVMKTFYFKPTFQPAPDREEIYLTSLLSTKVAPGNYPGDMTTSNNWPNVAPGTQGVNNALSPRYLNQGDFASTSSKPP